MPGLSSLALSVVIRGGARWEADGEGGWAHMLEHMVFKGAGSRDARSIAEAIEAEGGQVNAATGFERTSFQVRCLADGLPLGLEILSDLVRRPHLDGDELEREKLVIAQEIADAADTPDDRVFDLAQGAAFREQPLGRPILGTTESLAPATAASLSAFHASLYAADRIVVSASGAVDEDALLAEVERQFADMVPVRRSAPAPAQMTHDQIVETRKLEQAQLVWLTPGVSIQSEDYHALRLFAEILGGGMASRLFQLVRETHGLCYAIDAYCANYDDVGVLGIYAGTAASDAKPAARLIVDCLSRLVEDVTEAELSRARAQARAGLHMGREQPLARAEQAAAQWLALGRLIDPAASEAAFARVSLADLKRVGARSLEGPRASAVLGPKRAGDAAAIFMTS
jgi:predicted Zn-dependent peptidase